MFACAARDRAAQCRVPRAGAALLGLVLLLGLAPLHAGASILDRSWTFGSVYPTPTSDEAETTDPGDIFFDAMGSLDLDVQFDPDEQALAAVSTALRDDTDIQQILRDVAPTGDANAGSRDAAPDPGGLAASLQPTARDAAQLAGATPTPDTGTAESSAGASKPGATASGAPKRPAPAEMTETADEAADAEDAGLSLRQVLHAVAPGALPGAGVGSDAYDDEGAGPGIDVDQRLLDSHLLGAALLQIISVDDSGDAFSIFGVGQFEIVVGADTGAITLTEINTGLSADVAAEHSQDDDTPHLPSDVAIVINFVANVRDFLQTPTGILLIIAGATVFLLWRTLRFALRIRR
jgi:hypothetical protein